MMWFYHFKEEGFFEWYYIAIGILRSVGANHTTYNFNFWLNKVVELEERNMRAKNNEG